MRAMVLTKHKAPLQLMQVARPEPGPGQVLLRVNMCGVCRTDLHVMDGELPNSVLPIIPGHQVVGVVVEKGPHTRLSLGARVGVPWLGGCCGVCRFCVEGKENLCDKAVYTGFQVNGGYAEYCVANERFCFPLSHTFSDLQAAPLLCAGLIGYRALRFCGEAQRLGFYGFGSAAHILIQVAKHQGKEVYAFVRPGDAKGKAFALSLGAVWAGGSDEAPPKGLEASIIFAPDGSLVPEALKHTVKGGVVVCAGIHMSDIPTFPYDLLWEERSICSVANLTRRDGEEFLSLAPRVPVLTHVTRYPLENANEALEDLRHGRFQGAAVIEVQRQQEQ